jgi:hypothetical protein
MKSRRSALQSSDRQRPPSSTAARQPVPTSCPWKRSAHIPRGRRLVSIATSRLIGNLGRNVYRTDTFSSVDFRLTRKIPVKNGIVLNISTDVFNLFNRLNVRKTDTALHSQGERWRFQRSTDSVWNAVHSERETDSQVARFAMIRREDGNRITVIAFLCLGSFLNHSGHAKSSRTVRFATSTLDIKHGRSLSNRRTPSQQFRHRSLRKIKTLMFSSQRDATGESFFDVSSLELVGSFAIHHLAHSVCVSPNGRSLYLQRQQRLMANHAAPCSRSISRPKSCVV